MTTQIKEAKRLTMDTLTVEKYEKLKAGNATDGAIVSLLGTYPAKLIAWKRENGLMADKPAEEKQPVKQPEVKSDKWADVKKQAENMNRNVQEVAQQAEEPKATDSSSVDWEAKYNKLNATFEAVNFDYGLLRVERNDLFDKVEEFKRSHDEVWKKLQSEKLERSVSQNQLFEAEMSLEQFEEKEFALQETVKKLEVERDRVRQWAETLEQQNIDLSKQAEESNNSTQLDGVAEALKESEQLNVLLMKRVLRLESEGGILNELHI